MLHGRVAFVTHCVRMCVGVSIKDSLSKRFKREYVYTKSDLFFRSCSNM